MSYLGFSWRCIFIFLIAKPDLPPSYVFSPSFSLSRKVSCRQQKRTGPSCAMQSETDEVSSVRNLTSYTSVKERGHVLYYLLNIIIMNQLSAFTSGGCRVDKGAGLRGQSRRGSGVRIPSSASIYLISHISPLSTHMLRAVLSFTVDFQVSQLSFTDAESIVQMNA